MSFAAELLLALIPALLLFVALFLGRYPGERAIARAVAARTRRPVRAPRAIAPIRRRPRTAFRPGELIARSLANRPPPALLTA
jgi:hypothetical protein